MQNGILSLIEREYAAIREKNLNIARKKLDSALKDPAFKEAETKIKDLVFEIAKAENYYGDFEKAKKLKAEKRKIFEARKKILEKLNLCENDFKPSFDCNACKDTGFVNGLPCRCFKDKWSRYTVENLGISPSPKISFSADSAEKTEKLKKLYVLMKKYVKNFPHTNTHNFLFIGPTGCGKTYLSSIMASEIADRGYSSLFVTATELNQMFLKMHLTKYSERPDYMGALIGYDFLVIDDLGTENVYNNVTCECFLTLISERLAKNKHTVITTNLDNDEIGARYGDRFFSRITEKRRSAVIEFDDKNYREIKR